MQSEMNNTRPMSEEDPIEFDGACQHTSELSSSGRLLAACGDEHEQNTQIYY